MNDLPTLDLADPADVAAYAAGTASAPAQYGSLAVWADRHHWLNAIVGILDSAFRLTDDEQYFTLDIVSRLLDAIDVPFRGDPAQLPAAVAQEVESGTYAQALAIPHDAGSYRPVSAIATGDLVVSVAAWRNALLGMLTTAYPQLEPVEKMAAGQVFDDLLLAVGVPTRKAAFFPTEVIATHRDADLLH